MNVGIVVFSNTGNTLSVAQRLETAVKETGQEVSLRRVEPTDYDPHSVAPVTFKTAPDVSPYDAIVFASFVQAFSLTPVMQAYLAQVKSLSGKKVYCFVTQHFKKAWLGGNRAIRQMKALCASKGADTPASGVINWSGSLREKQIDDVINRFTVCLKTESGENR